MDGVNLFWATVSRYFKREEFADDKGECWIDEEFVRMLFKAREKAGVPFVITSGCRNEQQNVRVGGSELSAHLSGHASDIACTSSAIRFKIVRELLAAGFVRIGIGDEFIHVDNDPQKQKNLVWVYPAKR